MSCVYKGSVIETDLSRNSRGGTEQMRGRLIKYVDRDLLQKVAVHFSRPRELYKDVPNVLYLHDLATDPENKVLKENGWKNFDHFVFVSAWQRDQYIMLFGIPYSKCSVIYNAIELEYSYHKKDTDVIRLIYHTTPHRGLELVYHIVDELSKDFTNIHLDVYSSFSIYGWDQRDKPYQGLFDKIRDHSHMKYHGAVPNDQVLEALQKAHIFVYPSIWQETSCIAMIEALRSGCLCVHPNYGALSETASENTIMYDYTEIPRDHAIMCYSYLKNILTFHRTNPDFFDQMRALSNLRTPRYSIKTFTDSWNQLLKDIFHGR
jgi:UDP-glucose:(glucosyl)LPS alpha-1,2-glucosyltransferase